MPVTKGEHVNDKQEAAPAEPMHSGAETFRRMHELGILWAINRQLGDIAEQVAEIGGAVTRAPEWDERRAITDGELAGAFEAALDDYFRGNRTNGQLVERLVELAKLATHTPDEGTTEPGNPPRCTVCGSENLRRDEHEIDPGWRCVPFGHVVLWPPQPGDPERIPVSASYVVGLEHDRELLDEIGAVRGSDPNLASKVADVFDRRRRKRSGRSSRDTEAAEAGT